MLYDGNVSRDRRKSWFGAFDDPRVARDKLVQLVKKYYGRPHVMAAETRRMAYLSPDDPFLCAMDNNLEAHRNAALEREVQIIMKTMERLQKEDEWRALSDARRMLRMSERAVKEREALDKHVEWSMQQVLDKDRSTRERMQNQVRCTLR
jgi:transposase